MAAGKTTAAKFVENHLNNVFVSYENPAPMLQEIKRQGWNQSTLDGFIEIQRLFIKAEINRWDECKQYQYVLMDLGANEIEFFTLFYPKSIGFDWDVESLLKDELAELRQCVYTGVLFLNASAQTLINNKQMDITRNRGSFDHYLTKLLDVKTTWFSNRQQPETDFIDINGLTIEQIGQQVVAWIKRFIT